MKKAFFTLALLAVVTLLSAQTLQIEYEDHVYENGETIICEYDEDLFEYVQHLQIRNLSSEEVNVIVEQDIIETFPDVMVQFCWGMCYVPSTNPFASNPVIIPANVLSAEDFSIHIAIPETETGVVKVKYYAYDRSDPDNRISITILAGATAGVAEHSINVGQAYPNPASTQVQFTLQGNNNDNIEAVVYNLLGQEVKSQLVSGRQNRVIIAVDDLEAGIYFCRFSVNGAVAKTEKFIVKR
ncbi:MAG: T9SS type A sorting domain-containing protein [Bacteroidales bacterium]|nr:T9SS type A sorting domain-containing protein [Bacteroidales bacterium]